MNLAKNPADVTFRFLKSHKEEEDIEIANQALARKNPAAVALGKLGGASKSAAKQKASKKNGRKGGRPKKVVDKAAQ
jgi:hypothetical protein